MADTRVQLAVEDWVRKEWMPLQYGQKFHRDRVKLAPGGVFDCDAVSEDESIVATISTSGSATSSGKYAVGKMMKLRSDMFFLLLTEARRRIVVLTEKDMYEQCLKEASNGRVPSTIEFAHVALPACLAEKLRDSRKRACHETGGHER